MAREKVAVAEGVSALEEAKGEEDVGDVIRMHCVAEGGWRGGGGWGLRVRGVRGEAVGERDVADY